MWFVRTAIKHLKLDSMKNLKFRIWDKVENKYIFITKREDYDWLAVAVEYPELYDVQQFTGLLDKQSKEIYEGDIVRSSMGHIDEIVWSSGCFCLARAMMMYELTYGLDGFEVIGNIFENPELIDN